MVVNSRTHAPHRARKQTARLLPCLLLLCAVVGACRNDMDKVRFFDRQELPQQSLDSVRALRSQNGQRQMTMTAPAVVMYETPERKSVYPKGIHLQFFDNGKALVADVRADYAYSLDEKRIVEARNNVVVIDYESGDTTYLKSIVWNMSDHRVFSKEPVKSVNGQRVTYGDGFESDDDFVHPLIIRQRGTMTVEDD